MPGCGGGGGGGLSEKKAPVRCSWDVPAFCSFKASADLNQIRQKPFSLSQFCQEMTRLVDLFPSGCNGGKLHMFACTPGAATPGGGKLRRIDSSFPIRSPCVLSPSRHDTIQLAAGQLDPEKCFYCDPAPVTRLQISGEG